MDNTKVRDSVLLKQVFPEFPDTGHLIRTQDDVPVESVLVKPYRMDCMKVGGSCSIENKASYDTILFQEGAQYFGCLSSKNITEVAHRDWAQLIPKDTTIAPYNTQYAGACLGNINILGNYVESRGHQQGVFASDGAFKQIVVRDNIFNTKSAHEVTILGLLSGVIHNNVAVSQEKERPAKVLLGPMRLGGALNNFILGFKGGDSYQYEHISGVREGEDKRQEKHGYKVPNATYYINFDMDRFLDLIRADERKISTLIKVKEVLAKHNLGKIV